MKTTLIQEPLFTWCGSDLFCGAVFFCRLTFIGTDKEHECCRIEHVAFSEKITEIGWSRWNKEPFEIKVAGRSQAIELIESLYRMVFCDMEFTTSVG